MNAADNPVVLSGLDASEESKAEGKSMAFAFVVGMAVNIVSIVIGNPYIVTGFVLAVALLSTVLRGKRQRPWIFLATILAANPVNLNAPIACNLLFVISLIILNLNMKLLRGLPRWIYVVNALAFFSFILSAVNWPIEGEALTVKTQFGALTNYLAGPFLLLPLLYSGLRNENDSSINFKGLLYFIIIPSTLLILLAYKFGTPIADRGILQTETNLTAFKLGNTTFNLLRTQLGMMLASLICASVAALIAKVGLLYRSLAAFCLMFCVYLLLVSGSVGSALAGICGVTVILLLSMFHINILKLLLAITAATGLLFAVWTFADTGIKKYVMSRYEERFTKKGVNAEDRFIIWGRALRFIEDHPTGVGWSLYVDEIRKSPHNDYFVYAIAYSVFGGILYLFVLVRVGFSLIRGPKGVRETPHHLAVRMAGLGVTVAVLINSLSDHLTANRWYFNVVWSILWFSFFASGVTATGNMSTSDCRSATWHYSETSSSFQRDQQ